MKSELLGDDILIPIIFVRCKSFLINFVTSGDVLVVKQNRLRGKGAEEMSLFLFSSVA